MRHLKMKTLLFVLVALFGLNATIVAKEITFSGETTNDRGCKLRVKMTVTYDENGKVSGASTEYTPLGGTGKDGKPCPANLIRVTPDDRTGTRKN